MTLNNEQIIALKEGQVRISPREELKALIYRELSKDYPGISEMDLAQLIVGWTGEQAVILVTDSTKRVGLEKLEGALHRGKLLGKIEIDFDYNVRKYFFRAIHLFAKDEETVN
jgi:hypothetical protein